MAGWRGGSAFHMGPPGAPAQSRAEQKDVAAKTLLKQTKDQLTGPAPGHSPGEAP